MRLTRADDDSPHGKKLYLYASARNAYLGLTTKDAPLPVGFAIVKQSWTPRSASKAEIDASRASRNEGRTARVAVRARDAVVTH